MVPQLRHVLSEPLRKRAAAIFVGNHAEFFSALGGNAHLHQWLRLNQPFRYSKNRYELCGDIQARILDTEPIDYLEFGVRNDDSILKWATLNNNSNSRFIGFDSFEGLPEDSVSVHRNRTQGVILSRRNCPRNKRSPYVSLRDGSAIPYGRSCEIFAHAPDW